MRLSHDEMHRVAQSRDRRFDGQFVMAVHSTGIYCRPSCPSRTPRINGVTFYPTSAAAHVAGFRACKRCLPDAAPGSPAWDLRGDVVARAMRLIQDGVVEREGVSGLAARLGYSSRHLQRILVEELGAGALALARAQRAHTARMLLLGTALPMADVAFAAGFSSVRQFNESVREIYALTPSELRARRTGEMDAGGTLSLVLPFREPFDADGVFRWLAARVVDGAERAHIPDEGDGAEHLFARTLRLPGGPALMRLRWDGRTLRLDAQTQRLQDVPMLVSRARRLFDLDADPTTTDDALVSLAERAGWHALARLIRSFPGIRVPGTSDPEEMLVRAMVGQQISVAAARTHLSRLVDGIGDRVEMLGEPTLTRLFPDAATIAAEGEGSLSGPARRIAAITGAAAEMAAGRLRVDVGGDAAELREQLLAQPGIGPWTADYVRMRVTGDPDIFLPGDVAVRTGASRAGLPVSSPRALELVAREFAPWRSSLTTHLWRISALPKGSFA